MRHVAALLAVILAGTLASGCSTDETDATLPPDPSGSSALPPDPAPTIDVDAIWAGSVCTAIDDVAAGVGDIAGTLSFDPLSDQDVITQFESQLAAGVAELETETAALGAALGAAPVDYVAASSTITDLQDSLARVQAAGDVVQQHLSAAGQAGDPVTIALELGQAAAAARATWEAGTQLLDELSTVRGDAEQAWGPAFARAPECTR